MIKYCMLAGALLFFTAVLRGQELYVFSEPASNIPAKSVTVKATARYMRNQYTNDFAQRYSPEVMVGLSKQVMVKLSTSFSDMYSNSLRWESVKGYVKWRFYSRDGIHRHFRMAAFADGAYSRNKMVYEEMNLDGDNSGVQAGFIATQLFNKLALSGSLSMMRIFNEVDYAPNAMEYDRNSVNYSVSAGYLIFPFSYSSYDQVNLNLYVEMLGSKGLEEGGYYMDIAPAIQLIFGSATKLNMGARYQTTGNMTRVARNNYFVSVETSFLNAVKKRKK